MTADDLLVRYLTAWNTTDAAERRTALQQLFTSDVRYTDPMADVEGHDGIDATIAAVQARFPGFVFRPLGRPEAHHQQVRFGWELGPEGQEAPIAGSDVAVLDDDGRIRAVFGFLDRVPTGT
jgi:hypothetical protein